MENQFPCTIRNPQIGNSVSARSLYILVYHHHVRVHRSKTHSLQSVCGICRIRTRHAAQRTHQYSWYLAAIKPLTLSQNVRRNDVKHRWIPHTTHSNTRHTRNRWWADVWRVARPRILRHITAECEVAPHRWCLCGIFRHKSVGQKRVRCAQNRANDAKSQKSAGKNHHGSFSFNQHTAFVQCAASNRHICESRFLWRWSEWPLQTYCGGRTNERQRSRMWLSTQRPDSDKKNKHTKKSAKLGASHHAAPWTTWIVSRPAS